MLHRLHWLWLWLGSGCVRGNVMDYVTKTRITFSVVGALIALACIPLILRKVKPNWLYGFRTRLTLSSPEIWYPANVFGGWALLIASGLNDCSSNEITTRRQRLPPWLQNLDLGGWCERARREEADARRRQGRFRKTAAVVLEVRRGRF
ncbi:MAG: SdpI family protein, partial [Deltaproteobacteria bacterium]|nr:SdpI family protein [Deltaproteobacteria bacterium]